MLLSKLLRRLPVLSRCSPSSHVTLFSTSGSDETFCHAVHKKLGNVSGGMQGLTYAMMKAWLVYDMLCTMWEIRWPRTGEVRMAYTLPKTPDRPSIAAVRPIVLLKVTRKCWAGVILGKRGTLGVPTQLKKRQGHQHSQPTAKECPGCGRGHKNLTSSGHRGFLKAFDSVGVTPEIIAWLIELYRDNHTVMRSAWAVEQ